MNRHYADALANAVRHLLILTGFVVFVSAAAQSDGAAVYQANCESCHQAGAAGVPGVFPPLQDHLAEMLETTEGRSHLANAVLFGLTGPIVIDGQTYDGAMPSWFSLSDEEIAMVLNHVIGEFGAEDALQTTFEPFADAEIKSARNAGLSPELVHDRRPAPEGQDLQATAELPPADFSDEQVQRIRSTYEQRCLECHGETLDGGLIGGPPLRGSYFRQQWSGRPVAALYRYLQTRMPQDRPGSLSPQQYADLTALILSHNGQSAGEKELPADPEALENFGIPD